MEPPGPQHAQEHGCKHLHQGASAATAAALFRCLTLSLRLLLCAPQNLEENIDTKALHDTFEAFGKIVSAKVPVTPDGKSRGFGFIQFDTPEGAEKAIENVNGMVIEGRKVFVGPFQKKQERGSDGTSKFTNIFVKNLAPETDEAALKALFDAYGPTTSVAIMRAEDGASKGFGFVSFEAPAAAAAAVAGHNGVEVGGKPLFVGRAQKKTERDALLREKFEAAREERISKFAGMNLFVKNLDDSVTDDKLRDEFSPYGTIASAKVMRDDKGASKGFGFVCFSAPEEATRAVTEASGKMLAGKPIYVALHQRKEMRKAQLEVAYAQRLAMGAGRLGGPGMGGGPLGLPGPPNGMNPLFGPGGAMLYNMQQMSPGMVPGRGGGMMPQQMYVPNGMQMPGMNMGGGMGGPRGGQGMGGPYRGGPMPGPRGGAYAPMPAGAYVLGPNGLPQAPGGMAAAQAAAMAAAQAQAVAAQQAQMRGGGGGGPRVMPGGMGSGGGMNGGQPGGGTSPRGGMGPKQPGMNGNGGMGVMGGGGNGGAMGSAPKPGPTTVLGGKPAGAPPGRPAANGAPPPPPPGAPKAGAPKPGGPAPLPLEPVLTTATLASASPEQQKQLLGERLFPLVGAIVPDMAGKITGMLLEMDNGELLLLLESQEALAAKVDEAIQVLRQHGMPVNV